MFRLNNATVIAAAASLTLLFFTPVARASDEVAAFLERHGASNLLAAHLEEQIAAAEGDKREELILRLAGVYAQLLEATSDSERKLQLEERSRRLLALAPASGAEELRLALLRTGYRSIERTAENHRLRLANDADLEQARTALGDIIEDLDGLSRSLAREVEQSERRLNRASGAEVTRFGDAVDRLRRLLSQCRFLHAWAQYYDATLNDRPQSAASAERLFAELLLTDSPFPQPSDVSVDMRSDEGFARCILGTGLCKSITASAATALSWIELLEHDQTVPSLRQQVPVWKLIILLEHDEFLQALTLLREQREADGKTPILWWRLAAIHALENERQPGAPELIRFAVTHLAAQGELEQVYDLATRFGVDAMGDSGFALRYVSGLITYQEAREMHDSDRPAVDDVVRARYAEAAAQLRGALDEADVESYPQAAASCRLMIAWSQYFEGRLLDARLTFQEAAESLADEDAAEALWMAIVCLDQLISAGGSEKLVREREQLTDRYLSEHPGTRHAARLVVNRAMTTDSLTELQIEDLLAIPPGSDVYALARLRASQGLYHRFRNARGDERVEHGRTFLTVAAPIMSRPDAFGAPDDPGRGQRWALHLRRVLEVALTRGIDRAAPAHEALQLIDQLAEDGRIDPASFEDELDFRRLQFSVLTDETERAATIADQIWERDYRSLWARLASRIMFQQARDRMEEQDVPGRIGFDVLESIVIYGGRVLREFEDQPDAPADVRIASIYITVADASRRLLHEHDDVERGRAALFLYRRLLEHHPRNGPFLREAALLAERFDELDFALDAWRRLLAGKPVASGAWYEARVHTLMILAQQDPERARAVLKQYRELHPDFGPEPWGSRLRKLAQTLDEAPGETFPDRESDAANDSASPSTDGVEADEPDKEQSQS